eukprot:scaffold42570_cov50-Phaeocystis_antarctica.AAC.4
MHVLLLLICCVPGGGVLTSASLESSSDYKSPGRALAKAGPSSCRDVWGGTTCAGKMTKCSADCNTKSCQSSKADAITALVGLVRNSTSSDFLHVQERVVAGLFNLTQCSADNHMVMVRAGVIEVWHQRVPHRVTGATPLDDGGGWDGGEGIRFDGGWADGGGSSPRLSGERE